MENSQQNTAGSQPTSQPADEYSTPLPQGATVGQPSGQDEYSTPLPQGATIGNASSNPMEMQSSDSLLTKAGKAVGGGLEGIGEGLFGTLAGGADIVDKVTGQTPGAATNELHNLAGDNQPKSGSEQAGQSIETIGEFLMGDAALKGLSMADKLTEVSKSLKLIEGNGKLAQALALGINVGKAGATLGPEDRAAIKASPILARLVGAGFDAVRAGIVQGVQTEAKTGGDTGQAVKSGLGMAAGAGVVGGVLGTAGGLLVKGGEAADAASSLRNGINPSVAEDTGQDIRRVYHWSRNPEDIKVTDPNAAGTGVRGAERGRSQVKGTYFGEEGYKEPAVQANAKKYSADVDYNKIYDLAKDPEGLQNKAAELTRTNGENKATNLENIIKENGYDGYRNQGVVKSYIPVSLNPDYGIKEIGSNKAGDFAQAINKVKTAYEGSNDAEHAGVSAQLTAYKPEDYQNMRLFMSPDSKTGFALDGDNIVSAFSHPTDTPRAAAHLVEQAVAAGGKRLDAFDTFLPKVYARQGFKVVARMPFDPAYAPKGWDYDAMKKFNGGKPDVVFMVKDPNAGPYVPGEGTTVGSYDEGEAAQKQSLATQKGYPTSAEANAKLASTVKGGVQPKIDEATGKLNEANDKIAGASAVAESAAKNAPTNQAITAQAQTAAKAGHQALNDAYATASENVRADLAGTTVDYGGSKIHQIAQQLEAGGQDATDANPLLGPLKVTKPGSAKANDMVKQFADADGKISLNDDGAPTQLSADNLLDTAKTIKERIRNLGWSTEEERADRDIYHSLLDGVHGTLADLATKSDNPDALTAVQKMNADYKVGIAKFNNPDVKGILKGGAESRIVNLLSGGKSVGDVQAIKSAVGTKAFSTLADSAVQRIAADSIDNTTGQFNFDKFFANWNRIPTDVRGEMFEGSLKGGALENAINQVKDVNASGTADEAEGDVKAATDTMKKLLGNGDVGALLKDPTRVDELSTVVGPQAMGELGKTVLQNQLREAATDATGKVGNVDTGKVLKFIESLKDSPEVVNGLFKPTPETAKAYDQLIKTMQGVQSVKNAIKFGVLAPVGVGIGAAGGGLLGHGIIGALIAGNSEYAGRQIIEKIANSPQTWNTLAAINKGAQSAPANLGAKVLRYGAGRAANSLQGALGAVKNQLSQ